MRVSTGNKIILPFGIIGVLSFFVFVVFQTQGIYAGDSGDLVTAAVTFGVPHPPGYPLYTLLGWLVGFLPWFTPSWRVALLSSLPHAFVIAAVSFLVYRITKHYGAALFTAILLFGNYLFFLYSITPEVFALFDAFVIVLLLLVYLWQQTKRRVYLLLISGVFGLSLSHHHVILFFVPALAYAFWSTKKYIASAVNNKKTLVLLICFFILGLLPYVYIPIAANGSSMINWDHAVNLDGFLRLITRRDYGTFLSGGVFGGLFIQRLLQLKMYTQFILLDFHWIGLVLALSGIAYLYRSNRQYVWFVVLALVCIGPLFFFYASFPLASRFTIGTFERFLLPTYIILTLLMGAGIAGFAQMLSRFERYLSSRVVYRVLSYGGLIVLFLFPLTKAGMTIWRYYGLSTDMTANNLAYDLIGSLPSQSIVLLGRDTTLFTAQYVRYALSYRPDVAVLHMSRIGSPDYQYVVQKTFPAIAFPGSEEGSRIDAFINSNKKQKRIFANSMVSVGGAWHWVPYGLVYELVGSEDLPDVDLLIKTNSGLWKSFHDPGSGILGRFEHLMLSDVRDVYAQARFEYAKTLMRAGSLENAKEELNKAIAYGSEVEQADMFTYLGMSDLLLGNCDEALSALNEARRVSIVADKLITYIEAEVYRDCAKNAIRASELFDEYEKLKKQEETPLE